MTATVNIQRKSLSSTMATYFQSSLTLLESSSRLENVKCKTFYSLFCAVPCNLSNISDTLHCPYQLWTYLITARLQYINLLHTYICEKRNNSFPISSTYLEYITILHKGTDWGIVTKVTVKLAARASEIKSIEPGNKTKVIIQPKFAGYFGTSGLVPFKVKSFDGKVLAFHIVIIQTNGNSLLYLNKCQHL